MMDAQTEMKTIAAGDFETFAQHIVAAVLKRLCIPFLMLDEAGRVVVTNALSEGILDDGRHLWISTDGMLMMQAGDAGTILDGFLTRLDRDPEDIDLLLSSTDGAPPLFASLSAFIPPAMDGFCVLKPLAVMFVREGGEEEGLLVAQTRFRLSAAETLVLRSILDGRMIGEHARRRGISIHTARKQLNNVMRKLGVSRQSQLGQVIDDLNGRGRDRALADAAVARKVGTLPSDTNTNI